MQCTCGFKNGPDAKFCGKCGATIGVGGAVPAASMAATPPQVATRSYRAARRQPSRGLMAVLAVVILVAASGYWWLGRPQGRYKPDNSGLFLIKADGKYGYMDSTGKTVIKPQFDQASWFQEGVAAVRIGSKVGYIDKAGTVIITPQFDDAGDFRYGRARVKLCCGEFKSDTGNDRFGFIDKDGRLISGANYRWAGWYSEGLASIKTADGSLAFVDLAGKVTIPGKFSSLRVIGFQEGLAPAASDGKWGYVDTFGKWVIEPQFENALCFADGLAPVVVSGRTGYIDRKGKFVVNPQYEDGSEFFEGYASVKSGDKWGFINTTGAVSLEAEFLETHSFNEGLAAVRTDAGWGYIDPAGKRVISPQFDTAESFRNGLASVTALGKEAYVTTTGAFVLDPFPGTTVLAERARIVSEAAAEAARAKEAERVATEAREAEQERIARAIERQDAELKQNIANARSILVGSWKDENSLSAYGPDGTIRTIWDTGEERTGEWRVDGDVIVHIYSRVKSANGQWRAQATGSSSKLVYMDANVFRVVQNGKTWNNQRVSKN